MEEKWRKGDKKVLDNLRVPKLQEIFTTVRGTQRQYSSKPLKHSIVKRILVLKR